MRAGTSGRREIADEGEVMVVVMVVVMMMVALVLLVVVPMGRGM